MPIKIKWGNMLLKEERGAKNLFLNICKWKQITVPVNIKSRKCEYQSKNKSSNLMTFKYEREFLK